MLVDEFDDWVPTPGASRTRSSPTTEPAHARPGRRHRRHAQPQPARATAASSTTRRTAARPTRDATSWIADRANELIADGMRGRADERAERASRRYDFRGNYVDDLAEHHRREGDRGSGIRIGADPLGGASVNYWAAIAERYGLDLTVVNPEVDPTWAFMTLDWDGKIRMDPSTPVGDGLRASRSADDFDILTGNDADADRHGIVTPDGGLMNPNHYLAVAIDYLFRTAPSGARMRRSARPSSRPRSSTGSPSRSAAASGRCRSASSGSCPG